MFQRGPILCFLFFSLLSFCYGWIGDDYLITVRVILNFLHGFGPVFNIGERVQVYTHPLWFFLMSGVIGQTQEIFYSTILTSCFLSLFSVIIISKAHKFDTNKSLLMTFILFLTFSNAFMQYTTSGVENPLGYALFSLLVYCFYNEKYSFYIPLICGFLFLTRYDYLLLFSPILGFYLVKGKTVARQKVIFLFLCGVLVLSWLSFSLYYYGSLFPNTYYAKTFMFTPLVRWDHAMIYYKTTFERDLVTFVPILFFFFIFLFQKTLWIVGGNPERFPFFVRGQICEDSSGVESFNQSFKQIVFTVKDKILILSVLPYLIYVVWIGGDFMMGRFFAIPFFITAPVFVKVCFGFYEYFEEKLRNDTQKDIQFVNDCKKLSIRNSLVKTTFFLIVFHPSLILNYETVPISSFIYGKIIRPFFFPYSFQKRMFNSIIANERRFYFNSKHPFASGWVRQINRSFKGWRKAEKKSVSIVGFRLGIIGLMEKDKHLIDLIGLSDPMLSRFKTNKSYFYDEPLRPGHGSRSLPLGYYSTLLTNGKSNYICDKELKSYWEEKVKTKTRDKKSIKKMKNNFVDSFERRPIIPENFWTVLKRTNCKRTLQNLYLQRISSQRKSGQTRGQAHRLRPYDYRWRRPILYNKEKINNLNSRLFYYDDHIIYDLSAKIEFGPAGSQCFKFILDSFSKFNLTFLKEGKSIGNTSFNPGQQKVPILKLRGTFFIEWRNILWRWKIYRYCFDKPLNTENLIININCDPEFSMERFCYIYRIEEELDKRDSIDEQ